MRGGGGRVVVGVGGLVGGVVWGWMRVCVAVE